MIHPKLTVEYQASDAIQLNKLHSLIMVFNKVFKNGAAMSILAQHCWDLITKVWLSGVNQLIIHSQRQRQVAPAPWTHEQQGRRRTVKRFRKIHSNKHRSQLHVKTRNRRGSFLCSRGSSVQVAPNKKQPSGELHGISMEIFDGISKTLQQKNFLPSPYSALISLISLDAFSWDSDFHFDFEIDFDLHYAQDFHDHDFPLWMAVAAHSQVDNYILVDSHRLVADNHIQVDNIHKVVDSHRLVGDTWDLVVDSNTDWDGAEAYHRHAHSRLYSCRRLAHKGCQVFGAPGSVTAGENGEEIFSFLGASWFLFFSFSSEARHLCISSPVSHSSWMTQQLSNCMPYQDSDSSAHPLDTCGSEHSPATKKQLQLV